MDPAGRCVCLTSTTSMGRCTPTDRVAEGLQQIPSGYRLGGLVPDDVMQGEKVVAVTPPAAPAAG